MLILAYCAACATHSLLLIREEAQPLSPTSSSLGPFPAPSFRRGPSPGSWPSSPSESSFRWRCSSFLPSLSSLHFGSIPTAQRSTPFLKASWGCFLGSTASWLF